MQRYVLLRHECDHFRDGSHWDLMLERDGVLVTWAIEVLPQAWAELFGLESSGSGTVAATRLADHRIAYLDYEGPVSGNRGTVKRVASGKYERPTWEEERADLVFREGELSGVARLIQGVDADWRLTATPVSGD